ncbi:MAG: TVP38/TMEM64 family protein [Nitrospirota bacterium]
MEKKKINDKNKKIVREETEPHVLIGTESSIWGSAWIKLFFLLAFIIFIEVLYESGAFHFFLDRNRLKSFLDSLGPLSFIGFIVLQTLQVVAAPIPGEVTGFIGGYLYGPILGIVLSTTGLTLGSWLAFIFSKIFGRPFVEKFIKKQTIERYDYLLKHRRAAFLIFLLFLIPGFPKDYLCYILGLGPISTKEFLIISTAGRFSGTFLLTLGGTFIRKQQYREFFVLIGIAIIILLISMAYRDKLERLFQKWHSYKASSTNKK